MTIGTLGNLTPEESAALTVVAKSFALLRRSSERNISAHAHLTRAQFEILSNLASSPEGLRMYELADQLVLSRSTLTYHVTQLEEQGLVVREGSSSNQRAVVAMITQAGLSRVRELRAAHAAIIRSHFIANFTPEELAIVTAGFQRVVDSFGVDTSDIDRKFREL